MRVVDHHDAAEFFGEVAQRRQRAKVAIHAENTIGDQKLPLGRWQGLQDLACGADVLVRKHLNGGPAEAASIDDARVVQLVRHYNIILP